jgi:enoyl-CoA hydratase/carnithine racemase
MSTDGLAPSAWSPGGVDGHSRPLDKREYEQLADFRFALRSYLRFSEQTVRSHGMSPQQYQLMLAIKGFPGREWASVSELAERLQLKHHSVVELANRAARQGLVERTPHPDDARAVRVVLTAEGERAFCVGADLVERNEMDDEQLVARRASLRRMFATVREMPQPTIAAVFGYALGGGFELALSCDLIVAADDATFGLPEARVGLVPAGGGTYLLAEAIGPARARELIYTGRRVDADEARALGLVVDVVPRERLGAAADELAQRITRSSPVATRLAKAALRAGRADAEHAAVEAEDAALAEATESRDAKEGVRAFADKRDPEWENR